MARRALVRFNPCGHGSRAGFGLVGNDDAFNLRNPLGEQHLRRTYRFRAKLSGRFTASFLGRMLVEECAADRSRLRVAGRRLDALLPGRDPTAARTSFAWLVFSVMTIWSAITGSFGILNALTRTYTEHLWLASCLLTGSRQAARPLRGMREKR